MASELCIKDGIDFFAFKHIWQFGYRLIESKALYLALQNVLSVRGKKQQTNQCLTLFGLGGEFQAKKNGRKIYKFGGHNKKRVMVYSNA